MQYVLRERRIVAWISSGQRLARMRSFTTTPQFAQNRTVTTERP